MKTVNVTIDVKAASEMVGYTVGMMMCTLASLSARGIVPSNEPNLPQFKETLTRYLKGITGVEDIEVVINNDYFMSIHIEEYEYSYMIDSHGQVKEISSTMDILIEKIALLVSGNV